MTFKLSYALAAKNSFKIALQLSLANRTWWIVWL